MLPPVPPRSSSWSLSLLGWLLVSAAAATPTFAQPSWPQFRGPNGQGISPDAQPPIRFGAASNQLWHVPVAPGHSSPVVWGNHLFLTTYQTGQLGLVSFDRHDGRQRWQWSVAAGPIQDVHEVSSPAAPSAAADAARVYAYFGSWGLVAVDHEGREAWRRPLPPPRNRYGMATSPVLHGDHVILVLDADDLKSRIIAFRARDGSTAWETDRPGQRATWSTPAFARPAGENSPEQLVVLSALRLTSYDPRDGRELWSLDGFPQETVSVPVVGNGLVFAGAAALGGRGNEQYDAMGWQQLLAFDRNADQRVQLEEIPDNFRMVLRPDLPKDHPGYAVPFAFKRDFKNRDTNKDGALDEAEWNQSVKNWESSSRPVLMAAHLEPSPSGPGGAATAPRVAWKTARGLPEMPSLLHYRDRVYLARDGGLVTCLRAADGQMLYQERLGAPGQYCASPVAAADRIYLSSVNGVITVIAANTDTPAVIAQNTIGDTIQATPALVGRTLYLRTAKKLMAFAETPAP